jgi:D-3-phosphoglycerate dehydrogenase
MGLELAPLEGVLRAADVLTVHVPLSEATTGLVGAAQLAMLKPTAFLVNAARGGVVDEGALYEALRARRIAGAALDVYEREPLPADHPLRSLDNVVLTPHLGASTAEAQHGVALEIADAVRAALLEGDLSRAVNAPAVGGEEMRRLRPMIELAERLGRLGAALVDGPLRSVEVRYTGASEPALRPLAAGAMIGALSAAVGRTSVNFVNALHVAESRGVRVDQVRAAPHGDFAEYVELRLSSGAGEARVGGALLAEGHPRLVLIGDYRVDIVPRGTLVVIRNQDVPGVIGRVGTILGDAGVNIGEYHQARLSAGGVALAAVSVDGRLDAAVVERLKGIPVVVDVRQVELD